MSDVPIVRSCAGSVADALGRLTSALREEGIRVFAVIDHAEAAREAGLQLPDEVLVIFGNPAAGTALMQKDPRSGLALPLKILLWNEDGSTHLAYEPPTRLIDRFDLGDAAAVLAKLEDTLQMLAAAAAG